MSNKETLAAHKKICINCLGKNWLIECNDGCGKLIFMIDKLGRPRKYKKGHWIKDHKDLIKKGDKNPNWKGGTSKNNGYIMTYSPNHPNKINRAYVMTNRLIMEHYLKILFDEDVYIPDSWDVHHINGNIKDNSLINLELLSKSDHGILSATRDMSNRICLLCGSNSTHISVKGHHNWCRYSNGYICMKCYMEIYRKKKKMV